MGLFKTLLGKQTIPAVNQWRRALVEGKIKETFINFKFKRIKQTVHSVSLFSGIIPLLLKSISSNRVVKRIDNAG